MSKALRLHYFLGLIFGFNASALAAAPLVQFPVGMAAWTVDVEPSNGDGETPKKPAPGQGGNVITRVDVTQGDHYRCSIVTYLNGQSRTNWDIPGSSVILREDDHGNPFLVYKSQFYFVPFLPGDFAWLSPGLLQEKTPISYKGKKCFHYVETGHEAWVDSETLLPVALDDGLYLASFSFHPTPSSVPELPSKFRKIVASFTASMGIPKSTRVP